MIKHLLMEFGLPAGKVAAFGKAVPGRSHALEPEIDKQSFKLLGSRTNPLRTLAFEALQRVDVAIRKLRHRLHVYGSRDHVRSPQALHAVPPIP